MAVISASGPAVEGSVPNMPASAPILPPPPLQSVPPHVGNAKVDVD